MSDTQKIVDTLKKLMGQIDAALATFNELPSAETMENRAIVDCLVCAASRTERRIAAHSNALEVQ